LYLEENPMLMGKTYVLLLITILMMSAKPAVHHHYFVGYIKQEPVFDNVEEKKLFQYKKGSWKELLKYPDNYTVDYVADSFVCYHVNAVHGKGIDTLIYQYKSGRRDEFWRPSFPFTVLGADGKTCFTEDNKGENIIYKHGKKATKLGIKGVPQFIVGDYLYFCQNAKNINEEEETATADIYEVRLDVATEPRLVFSNTFGEYNMVSPDRKYLLTYKFKNGLKPVLVDLAKQQYSWIEVPKNYQDHYYDYKEKAFVFYDDSNGLQRKVASPSSMKWEAVK
jgi:hypothetical protein